METDTKKTFTLSDEEMKIYNEWYANHICKSSCSWTFTPTGIGVNVVVKCKGCGAEKDITDYGCW